MSLDRLFWSVLIASVLLALLSGCWRLLKIALKAYLPDDFFRVRTQKEQEELAAKKGVDREFKSIIFDEFKKQNPFLASAQRAGMFVLAFGIIAFAFAHGMLVLQKYLFYFAFCGLLVWVVATIRGKRKRNEIEIRIRDRANEVERRRVTSLKPLIDATTEMVLSAKEKQKARHESENSEPFEKSEYKGGGTLPGAIGEDLF